MATGSPFVGASSCVTSCVTIVIQSRSAPDDCPELSRRPRCKRNRYSAIVATETGSQVPNQGYQGCPVCRRPYVVKVEALGVQATQRSTRNEDHTGISAAAVDGIDPA